MFGSGLFDLGSRALILADRDVHPLIPERQGHDSWGNTNRGDGFSAIVKFLYDTKDLRIDLPPAPLLRKITQMQRRPIPSGKRQRIEILRLEFL